MLNNPYYDFKKFKEHFGDSLAPRQVKAETSYIYFLAHFMPFYTREDDPTLQQTIQDFSTRENPIYPLVTAFIAFAKENFFNERPQILDQPIILGNLINITFAFYIFKQPFPIIQRLVVAPRKKMARFGRSNKKSLPFLRTTKRQMKTQKPAISPNKHKN